MEFEESNNILNPLDDDITLIRMARDFVKISALAENFEDVYNAMIEIIQNNFHVEATLVYEAVSEEQTLFKYISRKNSVNHYIAGKFDNQISFGGIIGEVAIDKESKIVADFQKAASIFPFQEGSAIAVPIEFKGNFFGVVISIHRQPLFFKEKHKKFYELILEIGSCLMIKIQQKQELNNLRIKLEELLEEKKAALNVAIETVSTQFSELKFQRDKREILLHEVHHRVNNNLQVISSLMSLYVKEIEIPDHNILKAIQARIQILSSIQLILLRSLENDEISLVGFIDDLCMALRYNLPDNYLIINVVESEVKDALSFNTLIPIGMLIHELIQLSVLKFWENVKTIEFSMSLYMDEESRRFKLELKGENVSQSGTTDKYPYEDVQKTIVSALCEQIDGELISDDSEKCKWVLNFNEV
jgi:two-component sensor histidine kinase